MLFDVLHDHDSLQDIHRLPAFTCGRQEDPRMDHIRRHGDNRHHLHGVLLCRHLPMFAHFILLAKTPDRHMCQCRGHHRLGLPVQRLQCHYGFYLCLVAGLDYHGSSAAQKDKVCSNSLDGHGLRVSCVLMYTFTSDLLLTHKQCQRRCRMSFCLSYTLPGSRFPVGYAGHCHLVDRRTRSCHRGWQSCYSATTAPTGGMEAGPDHQAIAHGTLDLRKDGRQPECTSERAHEQPEEGQSRRGRRPDHELAERRDWTIETTAGPAYVI